MTRFNDTQRTPFDDRRGEHVPPSTGYGGDEIPPGTFHGGDEIPPGTFHASK